MYLLMFLAGHTKVPQANLCSVVTITEGVVVFLLKLEQHQGGYSGFADQLTIEPGDLWQSVWNGSICYQQIGRQTPLPCHDYM